MNRALRAVTILSIVAAGALVAGLHLVSDLDPVERRLSEYATDPAGPAMAMAFGLVGIGLCGLGVVMCRTQAVIPGVALIAAGVGMTVGGVFPTEPGADTLAEGVHSNATAAATVLLVGASMWWSFVARRAAATSKGLAVASLVLAIGSVLLHDSSVSGLSQRILWTCLLVWVIATAVGAADHR